MEVTTEEPLPDTVSFTIEEIDGVRLPAPVIESVPITSDWKPMACPHCATFGHQASICPSKTVQD